MTDLKPCPHCGGKAVLKGALGESWVSCQDCKASVEMRGAEALAIEAWNRRAPEAGGAPEAWRLEYRLPNGRIAGTSLHGAWPTVQFARQQTVQTTTVTPLYASPVLPDREGVARIIDPAGWEIRDRQYAEIENSMVPDIERPAARKSADMYTEVSLRKADAILAILSPTTEGGEDE